jgi:hypothetical protein
MVGLDGHARTLEQQLVVELHGDSILDVLHLHTAAGMFRRDVPEQAEQSVIESAGSSWKAQSCS